MTLDDKIKTFFSATKKMAIACSSLDEAKELFESIGRLGYKWGSTGWKYDTALLSRLRPNFNTDDVCFTNKSGYASFDWYERVEPDTIIIPYNEFVNPETQLTPESFIKYDLGNFANFLQGDSLG